MIEGERDGEYNIIIFSSLKEKESKLNHTSVTLAYGRKDCELKTQE